MFLFPVNARPGRIIKIISIYYIHICNVGILTTVQKKLAHQLNYY
jgi:hypothetical protein